MRGRTEEQIVEQIKQYLERHPNACREHIKRSLSIRADKLNDLESRGLVVLPKKVKPGAHSQLWTQCRPYKKPTKKRVYITEITQNTYD